VRDNGYVSGYVPHPRAAEVNVGIHHPAPHAPDVSSKPNTSRSALDVQSHGSPMFFVLLRRYSILLPQKNSIMTGKLCYPALDDPEISINLKLTNREYGD
jgi:hypothetical protein